MFLPHVSNMPKPIIDQTELVVLHRRLNSTTAVVPADDHVFDLKNVDRIFQDRETIEIAVHNDVRDIPVNKNFSRRETGDLVRRNPAIRASNRQILGRLLRRQIVKKSRIDGFRARRPVPIVFEESLELKHPFHPYRLEPPHVHRLMPDERLPLCFMYSRIRSSGHSPGMNSSRCINSGQALPPTPSNVHHRPNVAPAPGRPPISPARVFRSPCPISSCLLWLLTSLVADNVTRDVSSESIVPITTSTSAGNGLGRAGGSILIRRI
jgi:hypothetical protein